MALGTAVAPLSGPRTLCSMDALQEVLPICLADRAPFSPAKSTALVVVRLYCPDASWIDAYPKQPLWQLVLACVHWTPGRATLTRDALAYLRDFVRLRFGTPRLQFLFSNFGITVEVGSKPDTAGLGVSRDVVALYALGDVHAAADVLALLNEFLLYRLQAPPLPTWSGTGGLVPPHLQLVVAVSSSMSPSHATVLREVCERFDAMPTQFAVMQELPVDVFAAAPPTKRCDAPRLQLHWQADGCSFTGIVTGYLEPFLSAPLFGCLLRGSSTSPCFSWPLCAIDVDGRSSDFDRLHMGCFLSTPLLLLCTIHPPPCSRAHLFLGRCASNPMYSVRCAGRCHFPVREVRLHLGAPVSLPMRRPWPHCSRDPRTSSLAAPATKRRRLGDLHASGPSSDACSASVPHLHTSSPSTLRRCMQSIFCTIVGACTRLRCTLLRCSASTGTC